MTLGIREAIIVLIVLVAVYMIVVLWRMRRMSARPAEKPEPAPPVVPALPAGFAVDEQAGPAAAGEAAPDGMAEQLLRLGLEREIAQLRDEVDAMRGELAALRQDMQQEMAQMRATQTVSPIYGDAMQLAAAGYDPAAIAERCGIARAEAELVAALAKRQER